MSYSRSSSAPALDKYPPNKVNGIKIVITFVSPPLFLTGFGITAPDLKCVPPLEGFDKFRVLVDLMWTGNHSIPVFALFTLSMFTKPVLVNNLCILLLFLKLELLLNNVCNHLNSTTFYIQKQALSTANPLQLFFHSKELSIRLAREKSTVPDARDLKQRFVHHRTKYELFETRIVANFKPISSFYKHSLLFTEQHLCLQNMPNLTLSPL